MRRQQQQYLSLIYRWLRYKSGSKGSGSDGGSGGSNVVITCERFNAALSDIKELRRIFPLVYQATCNSPAP